MRDVPDNAASGLAIMAAAMLIAPAMDIIAKLLTETISPAQTAFGRFAAQSVLLLPLVFVLGEWRWPNRLHALAGICLGLALFSITGALAVMPVANAIAIFFVEPLILTVLSAAILGERLGWRRILAVLAGLGGAGIVLRPNLAAYGPEALLPLAAALFFSFYLIVTRIMAQRGQRVALQFWAGLFAMLTLGVLMAGAMPFDIAAFAIDPAGWRELGLLVAVGAIACVTHQMIAQAFARAEAGALAPLQYLEIISATALGWLVFGDFPDPLTWAGTAIIVAAGLYVFQRERRMGAAHP
ncbi:MAG: DMT family transporter [Pseudomonadota bacterium]